MRLRHTLVLVATVVLLGCLMVACLLIGSVDIPAEAVWRAITGDGSGNPAWDIIILRSRLPMIATAVLSGAALSVAGLLLQTTFNNPLAGPSILGVSGGAGLGVAIIMLGTGGAIGSFAGMQLGVSLTVLAGAWLGASVVLAILIAMAAVVNSSTMLLIVGILVSYLTGSVVSLLNSLASEEGVHNYVMWGFGTFNGVDTSQLPLFAGILLLSLVASLMLAKPLNALLLGTRYAENLGVNTRRDRIVILLISGALTATVTAYCGPIGFVGLIVPHIARLSLSTGNHNSLIPCCMLMGAAVTLLCTLLSVGTRHGVIPINAITPVIGVPIIIYIIIYRRRINYFN